MNIQKKHYDKMISKYDMHYNDKYSNIYRECMINEPLLNNINLDNMKVLEGMCGSGSILTKYLIDNNAIVTGLDISSDCIKKYKSNWKNVKTIWEDITNTNILNDTYDMIIIIGGLHHAHPNLNKTMDEIYRILKPNGILCFMEIHDKSIINIIRNIWYKFDNYIANNEKAIDIDKLYKNNKHRFKHIKIQYTGSLGYLFVLQSMLFRIPIRFKKYYSPLLIKFDKITQKYQNKYTSGFVLCSWRKKNIIRLY